MEKCSPVDTRANLEAANTFAKAGIDFVPIPVGGDLFKSDLLVMMRKQLEVLEKESE